VIGAPSTSRAVVRLVLDQLGSRRVVIVNKSSIAIAPGGSDKGTGLRAAIADLGLTAPPIVAIGDASNDVAMFAIATIAVGVANADDTVRASGAYITQAPTGRGVAEALERYVLQPHAMPAGD
jgi:hydroxymethylpyrimidine pyrophosphatase-like HAD family hydrolase